MVDAKTMLFVAIKKLNVTARYNHRSTPCEAQLPWFFANYLIFLIKDGQNLLTINTNFLQGFDIFKKFVEVSN